MEVTMKVLFAHDAGNGFIKGATGNDTTHIAPHALLELTPSDVERLLERNGKLNADYVQINDEFYVTGESVYSHAPTPAVMRGAQRDVPSYSGVLLATSLARAYHVHQRTRHVQLMAFHAPGDFEYRANLRDSIPTHFTITQFTKPHQPESWDFTIESVTLLEEGMGAFFRYLLSHDGTAFTVPKGQEQGDFLCFDLGHKTCEGLSISRLEPVYSAYGSIEMGIGDIRAKAKTVLEQAFATELKGHRLRPQDVDDALSDQASLKLRGKKYPVAELLEPVVNDFLGKFLMQYEALYQGGLPYDTILIAGGGAPLLWKHRSLLNHANVKLVCPLDQAIFANVLGGNNLRRFLNAHPS